MAKNNYSSHLSSFLSNIRKEHITALAQQDFLAAGESQEVFIQKTMEAFADNATAIIIIPVNELVMSNDIIVSHLALINETCYYA